MRCEYEGGGKSRMSCWGRTVSIASELSHQTSGALDSGDFHSIELSFLSAISHNILDNIHPDYRFENVNMQVYIILHFKIFFGFFLL